MTLNRTLRSKKNKLKAAILVSITILSSDVYAGQPSPADDSLPTAAYVAAKSTITYAAAKLLTPIKIIDGSPTDKVETELLVTSDALYVIDEDKRDQKHQKPLVVRLSNCVIQAEGKGNFAAERVYLEPLKMWCASSEGKIIRPEVAGFVSSADSSGLKARLKEAQTNTEKDVLQLPRGHEIQLVFTQSAKISKPRMITLLKSGSSIPNLNSLK